VTAALQDRVGAKKNPPTVKRRRVAGLGSAFFNRRAHAHHRPDRSAWSEPAFG